MGQPARSPGGTRRQRLGAHEVGHPATIHQGQCELSPPEGSAHASNNEGILFQEEGRFGSRTEGRAARIQVAPSKRSKTTTTTPAPVTTTTTAKPKTATIKKRLVAPRERQQGVLVYTTSTTTPVPEDEETKSLSQQVKDGKYGLIQELFSAQPSRPGILSYAPNREVPRDSEKNLGGLKPDEIWLSEGHMLVLSGFNKDDEDEWEPIDDYQAPPRQVKLPSNPSVPPPFPVQLHDGGPTGFVSSKNGFNPALQQFRPPGNLRQGNGAPAPPFPLPNQPFLPPSSNASLDEDDPSIYYPPPYDFSFPSESTTRLPPGPLVPGIVLPPPPSFFAPQNRSSKPKLVVPGQVDPFDFAFNPPEEPPVYDPPPPPTYQRPPSPPVQPPPPPPRPTYQPPRPTYQRPVELVPQDNQTNLVEPPVDDGYSAPGYPAKEPNVFLHHHGSPFYYLPQPVQYRNVTQIFPPEPQVVYEAPFLPSRKRPPQYKTVVSSTPSPTAIHYTLPPERGVQVSIYTATAPEEAPKVNHYYSTTTKAPMVVSHEYFTTQKPVVNRTRPTAAPQYYQSLTPKPITHEFFTTEKPRPQPKPKNVFYVQELPPISTPRPVYQQDSFQPSLEYPYTTTSAPDYYQGGYYPGYHQQRPYQVSHQTQALTNILRNLLNPAYFLRPEAPPPAFDPYRQPQRFQATTANPVFNGLYTQEDAKYMDDITKGFFHSFGSKVTTPLPPATEAPLHDDVRVNYRHPRPPVNPDSEFVEPSFVSYQLPGHGRLGPSHFYYISPRPPRQASPKGRGARPRSKAPTG